MGGDKVFYVAVGSSMSLRVLCLLGNKPCLGEKSPILSALALITKLVERTVKLARVRLQVRKYQVTDISTETNTLSIQPY